MHYVSLDVDNNVCDTILLRQGLMSFSVLLSSCLVSTLAETTQEFKHNWQSAQLVEGGNMIWSEIGEATIQTPGFEMAT